MKRKIREKRSKVFGTKQVLSRVNAAAHERQHRRPSPSSPTIASFIGTYRWRSN